MNLIIADCPSCTHGVDPYRDSCGTKSGECEKCGGLGLQLTMEGKQIEALITAIIRRQDRASSERPRIDWLKIDKAIRECLMKERRYGGKLHGKA